MTDEERKDLIQAIKNERLGYDEEEARKGYRQMGEQLTMIQEEMGLSRYEAIIFLSNMIGASMRK